ncbi:MAG: COR domain-containing protein [Calothrix sp. MO_167.B12]|nr:COR domain-containing protein [Calothrix sp. MO_167.B12]
MKNKPEDFLKNIHEDFLEKMRQRQGISQQYAKSLDRQEEIVWNKIQEAKEKKLQELNLRYTGLYKIPYRFFERVFELKWLKVLDLSDNELTSIPKDITRLQNLTTLNLTNNRLTSIPKAITRLQNLTTLDLRNNQLTSVPEAISRLQNLTTLDLRNNQLTSVPEAIANLTKLTTLDLGYNQLTSFPEAIAHLPNLTTLDLTQNQLTSLPGVIGRLPTLIRLDLSYNQLTTLPEAIVCLKNLTTLILRSNQLKTIPEAISRLQNLNTLDLSDNQVTTIPEAISHLQNLNTLYLSYNQLKTIPESISHLQNLNTLNLSKNPIEKPPPEVVAKGIEGIRDYFRQLEAEGTDYPYEAKLLIVGQAGAGKTTLAKKIRDENYQLQEEESTKGIDVIQWHFSWENGKDFRVNIWDFGGQEIYHATHQFFLTKRSLYALVADNRKEDTDFYYWLNVVELLSDNSPLLIVQNEKQDRQREINKGQLRELFDNLKETLETNLATNRGLSEVLRNIEHYITNLPHIGAALPKTWVRVREALQNDTRDYISLNEYKNICQQNGFTQNKDKLQLIRYLHDLGVCLHFDDNPTLNNTVILKPKWGTDAVYRVLDDPQVIKNKGEFTWDDLKNIWQEEKYADKQGELLALMKKFYLCYEIPGSDGNFIAPQLLSNNQPKYPDNENYKFDESNNLILRYKYEFMPKEIISYFIAMMYKFIDEQRYVWKSGVILNKDQTKAEVIEYYDKREIKIRVTGQLKKELMVIVTYELDKIHDSYKRLKYEKLIPCNCDTCKSLEEPHFYNLKRLQQRMKNKKHTIECDMPPYHTVEVPPLIDDYDVTDRSEKAKSSDGDLPSYLPVNIGNVENMVLNPSSKSENPTMPEPSPQQENSKPTLPWAYRNGLFYLLVFAVVFNTVGIFAGSLPIYSLALTIIGTTIVIITIGVLQLRQDGRLSEISFVKLTEIVLEQLPLIGNVIKQLKSGKQ